MIHIDEVRPEAWLSGTPYLVGEDAPSIARFLSVYRRSVETKARAQAVAAEVAADAREILEPFATALRTDLVAESNRLEGYEWSRPAVKQVVELHRELMAVSALYGRALAWKIGRSRSV